ncbi:uncharacterized protein TNCV_3164361 [Trichonephila clavipes]|nr:uncharacterized protein TNCV_3164361 [Trichonephila clavipes]
MGNVLLQRYGPIAIRRGKGPLTNAAVARMISKFEATGCLDDRPRSDRPSTRRNSAETVKDEMETVAGVPSDAIRTKSISINHELLPGDSVNRRAFAVRAFQKMADDDWLSNMLWTDEAHFTLRRPFFFEEMRDSGFVTATVTGERYADMLQNRNIPSLADKHLLERTIFMQDGAPPHIARRVKDLLRMSFGDDRVLSRHFHHAWPPRSPDLSPCDYWLWG